MKILLTGASGSIGSALLRSLTANSVDVVPCIRPGARLQPDAPAPLVIDTISGFTNWDDHLVDIDIVIHTAAMLRTAGSDDDYYNTNVAGSKRLAEAAASAGVRRFIFLSSVRVYGNSSQRPFSETDTPNPGSPYAVSKFKTELELARALNGTVTQLVILRLPMVYGPGIKSPIDSLVRLVKLGVPLPFKSTRNLRSMIAIDNLIHTIFLCLERESVPNTTYNVSDGQDVSTRHLVSQVGEVLGRSGRVFPFPVRILHWILSMIGRRRQADSVLSSFQVDISLIEGQLGWKQEVEVATGLRRALLPVTI